MGDQGDGDGDGIATDVRFEEDHMTYGDRPFHEERENIESQ